ncbi:MAG: peptidylprolyl isomerase, partial [Bryobacteraceae bacterium]
EELIENLPEQYRAMARGAARRQFLDQIINMKGLAGEARKRKLDQSPAFKRQLTFQEDNVLAALLYQDLASNAKVDDAALRQHFDQHKNEYEQCRARHILVRTKDSPMPQIPGQSELTDEQAKEKAAALKKRITGGEDFAAVAKAESDDATTRPSGGDLGQFRRGSMVPPFDQAAFSLPVKEISDPVRTPYGYHLIQVESRESKTFDEVKPEIEKKIRPERAKQAVDDIRKGIKVEVDDAYFGPARQ